ncbi:hypothetical protein HPP92_023146 [Vanilla planifolia]|uniref:Uncharacterized protein n=1 Tax=Vanilla planifolia TaxID=51239 RepID=A0A835UCK3_VANPL|nr:hypothetical protein HPP92_023146 [Vanilla planifolia]
MASSATVVDIANAANLTYCRKLRALGAELGWNLHNATTTTTTVTIVFSAVPPWARAGSPGA